MKLAVDASIHSCENCIRPFSVSDNVTVVTVFASFSSAAAIFTTPAGIHITEARKAETAFFINFIT